MSEGTDRSAEALDTILSELEDRGLLGWDKVNNRYDLHPIVRGVVWNGLDESTRHGVYASLHSHFEAVPRLDERPKSLADIQPAIELFNALVGLGRYEGAADIYFNRIFPASHAFLSEGAIHRYIAMLESLFPQGLNHLPGSKHGTSALTQLGHAYSFAGRLENAWNCYTIALKLETNPYPSVRDMRREFLAALEMLRGNLREAHLYAEQAVGEPEPAFPARIRSTLAMCRAVSGNVTGAAEYLRIVAPDDGFARPLYLAQIACWRGEFAEVTLADAALQEHRSNDWIAPVLLAEAQMNLGMIDEAAESLVQVLREGITLSLPHSELQARRVLAELYRRRGELERAREMLDDLWELARRGGYRLILADAHLVLARLEQDVGNEEAARAAAEEAYRQAYCDGPPYTYHWALIKAEALIEELGASIPVM